MNDWVFYGIAALIGFVGALVSQVITLQQSIQIKAQIENLEKKRKYCDTNIEFLCKQRETFQQRMWDLEEKIAKTKDTPDDKIESQYREFHKGAKGQLETIAKEIRNWDQQRNALINELYSAKQPKFMNPWFITILNVLVGTLVAFVFGIVEVISRGSGKATLTTSLVIEFLFAGAFWPLIWQRIFNTGAVQERVNTAVARFGLESTAAPSKPAGDSAPTVSA